MIHSASPWAVWRAEAAGRHGRAVAPAPGHGNGGAEENALPVSLPERRAKMLDDRDSLLRRLHEMRSEHRDLDTVIARLSDSLSDQLQVQRLKKRKLKLKDEIAWLESRLLPDIIA
jgi:hypothetical protein